MRIYICTPQKTRRFYNESLMGPRGLSITLCMCVCVRALARGQWFSSSKSVSCYYLLCEKHLWEPQQKRQYEQFHKGPNISIMLSKTSVSDGNRCMWTILHKHTNTNLHKHAARYTHAIAKRGRDYNIFSPQPD